MGGIYDSANLALYSYAHLNPLVHTDPDANFTNPLKTMVLRNHEARDVDLEVVPWDG